MDTEVLQKELQDLRESLDLILTQLQNDPNVSEETREAANKAWLKY